MNSRDKVFKITRQLLAIWGAISLIGLILLGTYVLYSMTVGNTDLVDKATESDVRFVLNGCELGDQRMDTVIRSYTSARSFNGEHLDVYAIRITNVTIDELTHKSLGRSQHWYRMDSLPTVLNEAISLIGKQQSKIPWFPTEDSLRTKDFFVYSKRIYYYGVAPSGTQLTFINPQKKMVYYVSTKL
jgi:hypothetical protein